MILLYENNETSFSSNGLGCLNDAITCEIKEELNGSYELEMEYPINGIHYSDIQLTRIILAKPNLHDQEQPFRIYEISKPMNGIVTIHAEHISYDMSSMPVRGNIEHYAYYVNEVFDHIRMNSVYSCPFTFETNISEMKKEIDLSKPRSVRAYLGTEDGLLSVFGGEWEFDRYRASLYKERGTNRGIVIEYGKNLIDLRQDEKCAETYTEVYPFWYQKDDGLQRLDNDVVTIVQCEHRRTLILDLTSEFDEMPTQDQLRSKTLEYIDTNQIGKPKVSLEVSYVRNPEVIETLQDIRLGDTVSIRFLRLGVDTSTRCISYEFNVITEQYNSVNLGDPESTIADTVADTSSSLNKEINNSAENDRLILKEVDGVNKTLQSKIDDTANGLSSDILQNTGLIAAEVTRATSCEEELSGRIAVTANDIIAEVTRATGAEGILSASLSLKIDKSDNGQIISMINGAADHINFTANNMFTVDSPNFSIDSLGNVGINGKVNATTGKIGDFNIINGSLENESGTKLYYNGLTTQYIISNTSVTTPEVLYDGDLRIGNGSSYGLLLFGGPIYMSGSGVEVNAPIYINNPGSSTADPNTRIQNNSNRLAISAASSQRYKHDIVPVFDADLDPHRLYDIEIRQYKYNLDYVESTDQRYDKNVIGFIAEDIYEKYPIAAEINEYGVIENWHARYMIPPMLALIQEQHKQIMSMNFAISQLHGEMMILKQRMEDEI